MSRICGNMKCFTENQMIVKPDKFQAIILQNSRSTKNYEPVKLEIGSAKIKNKKYSKIVRDSHK